MPAPKILSEGQWKILLDYMEANPIFAKGSAGVRSGQEAKAENNAQWKHLACRLNDVGTGRSKNYIQWRNYWNNIKYKVRKKACTIRKHMRGAVDGETLHRYYLLTKNEKRVLTSLGIPIPGQVRIKIKTPLASPTPDATLSPPDTSPPQSDTSPAATPSPDTPTPEIKSDPDSPRLASPLPWIHPEQQDSQVVPPAPEWLRGIEERRIAMEERTAQALQGILANTECFVNALQGIQFAQECLNKTMLGIQAALEASARALQERRS